MRSPKQLVRAVPTSKLFLSKRSQALVVRLRRLQLLHCSRRRRASFVCRPSKQWTPLKVFTKRVTLLTCVLTRQRFQLRRLTQRANRQKKCLVPKWFQMRREFIRASRRMLKRRTRLFVRLVKSLCTHRSCLAYSAGAHTIFTI
ncbi:unannotated protein [freshwater metagenome]|uniref:Unannotated protein n=1 Tax=freshwater metagenome TaxID=449393 RepID=A0A6J6DBZ6_9ZZZZ